MNLLKWPDLKMSPPLQVAKIARRKNCSRMGAPNHISQENISYFARGHFCPPLSFAGLFAHLNLAGSLLTVDNRQTVIVFPINLPTGKKKSFQQQADRAYGTEISPRSLSFVISFVIYYVCNILQ
jgi:hypothetical protein